MKQTVKKILVIMLSLCAIFAPTTLSCNNCTQGGEPGNEANTYSCTIMYCAHILCFAVVILVVSTLGMSYVDTSALYHIVRGQSVFKLYVIYNVLDVRY